MRCGTSLCEVMRYNAMQCGTAQHDTLRDDIFWCDAVQMIAYYTVAYMFGYTNIVYTVCYIKSI